ncbi:MAG: exopolysaccharide biosynthesis protein [Alphaproteobacteria bacterium]|nr:MAG: exopolysaccharide biosynthesis protein [Alphaproteobacteria bacterium]
MTEERSLLATLERLFAGPRDSPLTIAAFLEGLETRSYPFIVAALVLPNCVPTGLPFLSTVTGIPMVLVVAQAFLGRTSPWLPDSVGRRAMARGRLQDFLARMRPYLERIEAAIHPRFSWWMTGIRRRLLHVACAVVIVVLALPIPFDNLFAAWAILFFCLALLAEDGAMAMLGWLLTAVTLAWTTFLLIVGPWVVISLLKSLF